MQIIRPFVGGNAGVYNNGYNSAGGGGVGGYTCEQQVAWGKCSQSWMHPVCDYACGGSGYGSGYGSDPLSGYTCEQQAGWGKCSQPWMQPTCDYICGSAH